MRVVCVALRLRLLLVSGATALLLLPVSASVALAAGGVLDQDQANAGGGGACVGATPFEAQTFTASVTGTLDRVDVYALSLVGRTAEIRAVDGSGVPTGTALASATPVAIGASP